MWLCISLHLLPYEHWKVITVFISGVLHFILCFCENSSWIVDGHFSLHETVFSSQLSYSTGTATVSYYYAPAKRAYLKKYSALCVPLYQHIWKSSKM